MPLVSGRLSDAGLRASSGGLVFISLRTPGLAKPHRCAPAPTAAPRANPGMPHRYFSIRPDRAGCTPAATAPPP